MKLLTTAALLMLSFNTMAMEIVARHNVTVTNAEVVHTARESWITATAVNHAGKMISNPVVIFTLENGKTVRHEGPRFIKPDEAWVIRLKVPDSKGLYQGRSSNHELAGR